MNFISFGIITKQIYFILFMSLFDYLSFWTNYCLQRYYEQYYTQRMFGFFPSISLLFAIIPEILKRRLLQKSKEKEMKSKIQNVQNHFKFTKVDDDNPNILTLYTIVSLIIIGLLYTCHLFIKQEIYSPLSFPGSFSNDLNQIFFPYSLLSTATLIVTSILCKFIFGTKIYRHHLLGLVIIIICTLISLFIVNFSLESSGIMPYVYMILSISIQSILPIAESYIMKSKFISPYLILFSQGVISFIYSIIMISTNGEWNKVLFLMFTGDYSALLYLYSNTILYFFFFTFTLLTLEAYSPTHIYISPGISGLFCWCFQIECLIIGRGKWEELIYFLFSYPIWCFGCVVYNELIILDFCSFGYHTRKKIIERGENEKEDDQEDDSLIHSVESVGIEFRNTINDFI